MKIIIKESAMVCPVEDLPSEHLWLSNIDQLCAINVMPTVYFYKTNDSTNPFQVKVLKEALSKVLVAFYPVAGRLERDDKGRFQIDCNGEGVLFIEAETDSTIQDLGDLMLNEEIPQLIPTADYSNDISSFPLLVIQVTSFSCGGVSLGLRLHHILADGAGALHFIYTWFNLAHGLPISIPPFIDRTILRSQVPPTPKFKHIEYEEGPIINTSTKNHEPETNSVQTLKITPQQLSTLKTKVKSDNLVEIFKCTTYEILAAHIWRCACKARDLPNDQATKLYMTVDGRSRLHPPLPPGYFGNAIFRATPMALAGELLLEPLKDTVERIQKAIRRMDNEYLRSAIDYLEITDAMNSMMRSDTQFYQCPNINIVSWMRLPFYDADFGMGKPICLRPARQLEGKAYILPYPSDDGSWALNICLETNHMQSFPKLFYEF